MYFSGRLVKTQTSVTTWNWPDRLSSEGGKHPYGEGASKFATYWPDGGLHYAMNRYYSSTYGRFTTRIRIGLRAGRPIRAVGIGIRMLVAIR